MSVRNEAPRAADRGPNSEREPEQEPRSDWTGAGRPPIRAPAHWSAPRRALHREVERKAERRLAARRDRRWNSWFGVGMFGMVGWSVALPTLVGIALGVWIDRSWPGPRSWTLTLMFGGLTAGLLMALHWVHEEGQRRLRGGGPPPTGGAAQGSSSADGPSTRHAAEGRAEGAHGGAPKDLGDDDEGRGV